MWKRFALGALTLCLGICQGCALVGPSSLRMGRPAYNDAILATSDQQLLENIVRLRFGDTLGFLTVASITASMTVGATGAYELPFGPESSYAGAVIPFRTEITAEEQPTITYAPVKGDELLQQLLNPMSLDLCLSVLAVVRDHQVAWESIVKRLNDLQNPDFVDTATDGNRAKFEEAVSILAALQDRGLLSFANTEGVHAIAIRRPEGRADDSTTRLMTLLNVKVKPTARGEILLPLNSTNAVRGDGEVAIETRSLLSVMQLAAAQVELPEATLGKAMSFGQPIPAAKGLTIRSSAHLPDDSRVAVPYRGYWYYIAQTDEASKRWFLLLEILASASIRQSAGSAPVITIPAVK